MILMTKNFGFNGKIQVFNQEEENEKHFFS